MGTSRRTATNENVSTYGNGTRNYSTIAGWEAATDIDLVTATQSEILECYDDEASFDDNDNLDGATCNASYFRIIRPASAQGHDGTPNNGIHFNSTTDAPLFRINEAYSQIQDLIGTLTINSATARLAFGAAVDQSAIIGCIAIDCANAGAGATIGFMGGPGGGTGTKYVVNCLAIDGDSNGFESAEDIAYYYNCSSIGNAQYGFDRSAGTAHAINCCASGNTAADWRGTWATRTTCTAESANPTYVNPGGDDYHLAVGDTVCRGNGTDLSGDGTFAFDDDIDLETRSAWDIGSDEYSAPAGGIIILRRRRM